MKNASDEWLTKWLYDFLYLNKPFGKWHRFLVKVRSGADFSVLHEKKKGNTNNKNIFQSKTRCAFLGDVFFYNLYLENIFFEIIFAFEILIKN